MAEDSNRAEVTIGAKIDEAIAAIAELKGKFQGFAEDTKSGFDGLTSAGGQFTETVNQIKDAFVAITAVLAGGKLFGGAIEETQTLTKGVNKLSIVLGLSHVDAQALATGLEMIGSSSEAYLGVVQRVTMRLNTQEASFNTMGVATRDASGHLLDAQVVMQNIIKHLDGMKAGTDRNLEATQLLGRSWQNSLLYGRLNAEMLADVKAKQAALDMQITGMSIDGMFKYMGAMVEAKEVFKAVALSAGQTMMPRLTELAHWFADIGPSVVKIFNESLQTFIVVMDTVKAAVLGLWNTLTESFTTIRDAMDLTFGAEGITLLDLFLAPLKAIQAGVIILRVAVEEACLVIKSVLTTSVDVLITYASAAKEALTPGANYVARVKAAWHAGTSVVEDDVQRMADGVLKIQRKMEADLLKVYSPPEVKDPEMMKTGGKLHAAKTKGGPDTSDADLELALAKKSLETQKEFLKGEADAKRITEIEKVALTKTAEDAVYVLERGAMLDKVNLYKEGSKQYQTELNKVVLLDAQHGLDTMKNSVELQAAQRKAQKESLAIEEEGSKAKIALWDEGAKLESDYLDQQVQLGIITSAQKLVIERQYMQSVHDVEAAEMATRAELYRNDEKEYQKHLDALAKFNAAFQVTLQKNTTATLVAEQKEWQSMLQPIASAFDTTVKGIIMGTTTLGKGMSSIFQSVLMEFLSMCTGMMVKWAALEAWKLATTEAGSAARLALDSTTSLSAIIKAKMTAMGLISASAVTGAAASLASTAAIPIIGPELAPAAAAATYSEIMAFEAGLAGFAGGTPYVQHDMIAKIHEGERITTKADNAKGGSGGGITVNINSAYADAAGIRKLFMDHGPALSESLRRQARNFTSTVPK